MGSVARVIGHLRRTLRWHPKRCPRTGGLRSGLAGSAWDALEPLEPRILLSGSEPQHSLEDHIHADLAIYIEGEKVAIPQSVGIGPAGFLSPVHTHDADNRLHSHPINGQVPADFITVGDFFETWRNNAGIAGDRLDSIFNANGDFFTFNVNRHFIPRHLFLAYFFFLFIVLEQVSVRRAGREALSET